MWADALLYESIGLNVGRISELSIKDRGIKNCECKLDRSMFLRPIVEAALSVLSPTEKEVFLLHHLDGLRQYEIARLRNTSRQAVQDRLVKAHCRLMYWRFFWYALNYINRMHRRPVDYIKNARVAAELTLSTFTYNRPLGYRRKGCKDAQT